MIKTSRRGKSLFLQRSGGAFYDKPAWVGSCTEPLPSMQMQLAFNGSSTEPLPSCYGVFSAEQPWIGEATEALPSCSGSMAGAGSVTEPLPSCEGTLLLGKTWNGSVTEASPQCEITATLERCWRGEVTEPLPKTSGVLYRGLVFTGEVTEPLPQASGVIYSGRSPFVGGCSEPLPSCSGVWIREGLWSGAVIEPLPSCSGVWVIPSVPANVKAYCMHTEVFAVTTYTNFDFAYLGSVGGTAFGAKADGIYKLDGATDNGTAISCELLSGQNDFGVNRYKRVPVIHIDADGTFQAVLEADGSRTYWDYARRAKPGRGIIANRVAFGVKNVSGSSITVRSIEPTVEILTRKAS